MKRLERLIPPPLVMLFVGLLMWVLCVTVPALTLSGLRSVVAAASLSTLGIAISLAGIVAFRRAGTTIDPKRSEQTTTLIRTGVYRYSRNPMYLGMFLVLMGWAFYLGNLLSILSVPAFIVYLTRFQIMPEERVLQEKFGTTFLAYKNNVGRWC